MDLSISDRLVGGKLLVATHKIDRLGDLSTGCKAAALFERLGGVSADRITVVTNAPEDFQRFFDPTGRYQVIGYPELAALKGVKLAVVAPFERGVLGPELVCGGYPVLCLSEYGRPLAGIPTLAKGLCAEYLCGFSTATAKTLGLWIDPELKAWSKSGGANDPVCRLQVFQELKAPLQEAIRADSKLYLGYAATANLIHEFVQSVICADKKVKEDLVFALPGRVRNKWKSALGSLPGIASLTVLCRQERGEIEEIEKTQLGLEGKKVTILSGFFTSPEVSLLWKLCERDVLVAGDQTLSEAISANKSWLWEQYDHKTTMGERIGKMLRSFGEPTDVILDGMQPSLLETLLRLRSEEYRSVDARHAHLWETHDCGPRVIEEASQLLTTFPQTTLPADLRGQPFKPTELEPGCLYILDTDQISQLQLPRGEKVESLLPQLKGLLFQCERGNYDYFVRCEKK